MKVTSTVRRGADGKGTQVTSPAAYPTKAAILSNAATIICGHNHPSGDTVPSQEDRLITTRLVSAGKLLGINVLDHIVIGGEGRYFSFADAGALEGE